MASAAAAGRKGQPRGVPPWEEDAHLPVKSKLSHGLAIATLNRPRTLNCLEEDMLTMMWDQYNTWLRNPVACTIMLKGEGPKAFCAGGDVKFATGTWAKGDKERVLKFFGTEYQMNYLLHTMKKSHVAFLDGIVMGGGAGMSMHGLFNVATEKTMFAMPECALGLFPDVGASHFLTHKASYPVGLCLALTGMRVYGNDVKSIGLASHYIPSFKLDMVEHNLESLGAELVDPRLVDVVLTRLEELEPEENSVLMSKMDVIHAVFSEDKESVEEIVLHLRSLTEAGDTWCEGALKSIEKASPSSLRVTLEQMRRGKDMPLRECLKMEFRLLNRFLERHDFYEGVRSILIDKDNKPTWEPASLAEVTDAMVAEYFARLPERDELELVYTTDIQVDMEYDDGGGDDDSSDSTQRDAKL